MTKNTNARRAVLLLLAALLALGTACGGEAAPSGDTNAAGGAEDTTTAAPEIDNSKDELPALDFGGKVFKVLAAESTAYKGYLDVEEQTGDILNDALFNSNRAVEERLNIVFEQTVQGAVDANNTGGNLIMAGDHVYDLISLTDRNAFSFAVQGMLLPYDDMPYVDLEKDYWVQGINDVIRMDGTYWLAYGDFNLSIYDYTYALAFNKKMLDELKLDDPYALVDSGKWTIDTFQKMCLAANMDLNGDTKMDDTDRWGWSAIPKQIPPTLWIAAGAESIKKNKEDLPEFTMASDSHFSEVYAKIYEIAYTTECWAPNTINGDVLKLPMFKEGRALFQTTSFGQLDNDYYRTMETDFGILPHPKWDEAQKQYYSRVEGGRLFAIPVTTQDKELVGATLEALSYQASVDIIPAYFEITLKAKYTRDDESARMFDLIMDTRVYDLGDTMWSTQCRDGFIYDLFYKSQSDALASAIAENKAMMEGELQKTIDGFKAQ